MHRIQQPGLEQVGVSLKRDRIDGSQLFDDRAQRLHRRQRTARRLGQAGLIALVMMLVTLLAATAAGAHRGDQSYLYLDVGDGLTVEVHMPFIDLREHLGLTLDGTEAEILDQLAADADVIAAYAADHARFSVDGSPWELVDPEVTRYREGEYVSVRFQTTGTPEEFPQVFTVRFDPFFDENPERDGLLIVRNDFARGIVGNEEEQFVRFTPENAEQEVDLGDASAWKNLTSSIELGVDHIRTGPDHVLFIAVLLLPAVLVFRREWHPVDSFGRSLIRVVKMVSMFTVAHSITFTIAGLGIIEIDDFTAVEAIIAVSIAAAALHNIRPIFPEREWLIAFGFGLFHGLGFASLVADLDVARSTQLVSLLGRNIGIEIGQIVVVLVTFPSLFLLRRTRWYRPFFIASSVALTLISLGWFGERVFDTNDWASRLTDAALALPRAWWLLAIFTALCAGVYEIERRAGRLLDTVGLSEDSKTDADDDVALSV